FRLRNIANGERQAAINTESLILGRRSRRHAVPSVVVNICAAYSDTHELPEKIGLLISESPTTECRNRICTMLGLKGEHARSDFIQGFFPGNTCKITFRFAF